ncbi:MAG: DUF3298 and DUF4163 domain-containing protein [Thermoproteota archaeon]|nr:DUF3298 and DUF4163 domain-containing protein [Thermoproteota archaeon]
MSCKPKEGNAGNQSGKRKDSSIAQNFYKRFEGTIAGQPVILHLHKTENKFSGIYYYRKTGGWLTIIADTIFSDSILLSEYAPVYNTNNDTDAETLRPQLKCKLQNDMLTGTWVSSDKKTSYPINLKENYPSGSYKFSLEDYADSIKAFPQKNEPMAEMNNSFVVCINNSWLNGEIKKLLSFDSSLDFKAGFNRAKTDYFNDYKKDVADQTDTLYYQTLNYSLSQNLYVRYNENDIVILESEYYMFSGGAHGNYGNTFFCFDVAAKKQLKLSDIIAVDSATLQPIVEKYFRTEYNVKSNLNEILFNNHLPANDNFYFNEKKIGYLYNPYEVAYYAQGQIDVFIPLSALQKFINPDFKKRMGINF